MWKQNISLLALAGALIAFPLFWHRGNEDAKFAGADDAANQTIESIAPAYKRWFQPLWEPPSSEVASMLFALQAAAGAGVLCFGLGWMAGRHKTRLEMSQSNRVLSESEVVDPS